MAVDHLRWFAEEARRAYGRIVPNQVDGKRHLVVKTPMGVVGAISPWNFPLVLAVRKVAPALAAGLHGRAEARVPDAGLRGAARRVRARRRRAPRRVPGRRGAVVGVRRRTAVEPALPQDHVHRVHRGRAGCSIRGAAASVKPLSLELGGHAPVLVFADADLDAAVEGALAAKFRNTGQSCIAANRVYVERPIYERFLEAFVAKARGLKVGDGLEPGVDIGPLFDEAGVAKAIEHVEDAVAARRAPAVRRQAGPRQPRLLRRADGAGRRPAAERVHARGDVRAHRAGVRLRSRRRGHGAGQRLDLRPERVRVHDATWTARSG